MLYRSACEIPFCQIRSPVLAEESVATVVLPSKMEKAQVSPLPCE